MRHVPHLLLVAPYALTIPPTHPTQPTLTLPLPSLLMSTLRHMDQLLHQQDQSREFLLFLLDLLLAMELFLLDQLLVVDHFLLDLLLVEDQVLLDLLLVEDPFLLDQI